MSVIVDIDLRDKLRHVRDQGPRPTCLVFAATAAHEAHLVSDEYFSVEYLFYHGALRSHSNPNRGLSQNALAAALEYDGQPKEAAWPYLTKSPKKVEWSVPSTVAGAVYRAKADFVIRTVDDIRATLAIGTPVVLTIGISPSFYIPDVNARIFNIAGEPETAKHALVAVGAGHDEKGAYLLVRNSWGDTWGESGHAWLHEEYVGVRMLSSAIVL
ncbi:C1 family peptidase [Sorangium sp. So ce1182]|uniref:C1 family peptidase n=1 Tax=Sorangium sp. So ce1182 TaxID=3133334 RepID=UPI003F5DC142